MTEKWNVLGVVAGGVAVEVLAHIRNNETGEVRSRLDSDCVIEDGEGRPRDFIWSEGNYSCDCNRALFFAWAVGADEQDNPCGDGRYSVNLENPATGRVFYREFGEAAESEMQE